MTAMGSSNRGSYLRTVLIDARTFRRLVSARLHGGRLLEPNANPAAKAFQEAM